MSHSQTNWSCKNFTKCTKQQSPLSQYLKGVMTKHFHFVTHACDVELLCHSDISVELYKTITEQEVFLICSKNTTQH